MTHTEHNRSTHVDNLNLASIINGNILRRAVLVALVTGGILTLANQSAAVFGDEELEYLPLALVFMTPCALRGLPTSKGTAWLYGERAVEAMRQHIRIRNFHPIYV